MADNIPISFPIPTERGVVSYDYTDIAAGVGIVTYYLSATANNAGTTYCLSDFALPVGGGGGTMPTVETDFDLNSFKIPRYVSGTAYLAGWLDYAAGDAFVWTAQLKKVSGGVETDISSLITSNSMNYDQEMSLAIPLTSTHFKIGDTLRLTTTKTAGGTGNLKMDPTSLYSVLDPMKLYVPFKLEL